ncbi:carboxyl transferase domain-containing protein [Paenibacillus sp. BSR1-1]|uniref:acyl-CoA carboxylase subunit beta n=1 Tax=Paenibacillus sp. BSR1-1 TaxID=3020845 RepID=UPI0025B12169|nr:carboxyl transferase domain-containing protein [Paenibacillus sp. BSR1-1]MDN3015955.1 carboxyl transferase domain-containing protein [Paenibacillus sp. BSR1-1]
MDHLQQLTGELQAKKETALLGGGKDKIAAQHGRGLQTARERIEMLADHGTFMELGMLNTSDVKGAEDKSYGDGLIAGVGKVNGRPAVIQAGDKTVFAGTEGNVHIRKSKSIHEFAIKNGLPIFSLHEGGGLRMPDGMGSDGISDKLFPREMLTLHRQVPTMTAILGDSFGGPTWAAVSSDFVTQLQGTCMAIAGPRMLELANGQKLSPEELGGVDVHHRYTGQIDEDGATEEECMQQLKTYFSYMPQNAGEKPRMRATADDPYRLVDEVLTILPQQSNRVYNMKKIIDLIVDDGITFEFQRKFGKGLITAFAHLNGHVVGIVANQPSHYAGAPGPQECQKATEFICLCDSYHIPLIFLHDTPGFRISSEAEKAKMPTKIMVWNQALALSTVPKISVVIRKSIGAAYGNMCGPGMGGDLVVAWPTAEINFTGPEVGVNVVFGRELARSENPSEDRKKLLELWSFDSSPYKAAAKHLIDDIIQPNETRKFLCQSLEYLLTSKREKSERLLATWPTGI